MSIFFQTVMDAVRQAVKDQFGGNISKASHCWGISGDNLHKWLRGDRIPTLEKISPILDRLGRFTPDVPAPLEEHAVIRRVAPHAPSEIVQGESLPRIPVMGGTGAGDDVEIFQSTPSYWISVLPQYKTSEQLIGLVVYGDSMEPTIHKGAVVGVIPFDGTFNEGGIYLVQRPPFGRTIKRVKLQGGQLVLLSDNAAYEPAPLPFEGYENIILGRVVWVWQML